MKRPVEWSDDALSDLDGAAGYIAEVNPGAARRLVAEINRVATNLGDMATGRPGRRIGTYEKVVANLPYILAYALHTYPDRGEAVVILRVIHTARDWSGESWPK